MMKHYAVALRRSSRAAANYHSRDLIKVLRKLAGELHFILTESPTELPPERRVHLIEALPEQAERLRERLGDWAWIELDIPHFPQSSGLGGFDVTTEVRSSANGKPLFNSSVALVVTNGNSSTTYSAETDVVGHSTIWISGNETPKNLIVAPIAEHWSMFSNAPTRKNVVYCPELKYPTQQIDWWHGHLGIKSVNKHVGARVRVAVIDSGCAPHPALGHVNHVGTLQGTRLLNQNMIRGWHGTHVCGIIGGRPTGARGYWGIVPGAELYSICVTPNDMTPTLRTIATAIRRMSQNYKADLINLSYSADSRTEIVIDAVKDAESDGCLCICAAGNYGGFVRWPAAAKEVVAVSAVGEVGRYPVGTMAANQLQSAGVPPGRLAFANFSCYGPEIDCCGPGVGIVSTVPGPSLYDDTWAPHDGTSMATPAVCGILAASLSQNRGYLAMPRDAARAKFARAELVRLCRKVGLPTDKEGNGMPFLT